MKLWLRLRVHKRDAVSTDTFIGKLRYATSDERFQSTSDGFNPKSRPWKCCCVIGWTSRN